MIGPCKLKLLLVNFYVVCGAKDLQDARKRAHHDPVVNARRRVQGTKQQLATGRGAARPMLYKPHTPMELGDAVLGQLTSVLVFMFDHMIPAVHNVVSWETDDIDLGPIIPEWSGDARLANDKSKSFTPQPRALSA